jgi:predicted short-subunit dehydrogenase-like oxidoreductase (DUF2520 family)
VTRRLVVVGRGRLGSALTLAVGAVDGWSARSQPGRSEAPELADADVVLICVPDGAVAEVAARLPVDERRVVGHCSGALGLDVLAPHPRRGSLHPLVSVPDAERGAAALHGAWAGLAGDPLLQELADGLGMRTVHVADDDRRTYHAAAVIASNHLVALLGQVARVGEGLGVPLDAFVDLARGSLENAAALGPADALTGPVARGDWTTVRGHLEALPEDERAGYLCGAHLAARLAGRDVPDAVTAPIHGPGDESG